MKSRDRNHLYLYTVKVRKKGDDGVEWWETTVKSYNIIDAAYKLGYDLNDVQYVHKEIIR